MCAASRSSSGCFSADIQANSQFFESNDNSEVKQICEDIYNTYNQKLSLPTIWENMPNNCQIYGLEPIYMVCNQIYGIWPNIWYMAIYMAQKLPYIWIWPYHEKTRYGRPLDLEDSVIIEASAKCEASAGPVDKTAATEAWAVTEASVLRESSKFYRSFGICFCFRFCRTANNPNSVALGPSRFS